MVVQRMSVKDSIKEVAKEALGLFVKYMITISEATKYWEDEIKTGLISCKYIDNINNRQYSQIKNIFDRLLQSQYLSKSFSKYNWRIYLQNTSAVNAFAAFNGIIIINKGIIDLCQDDNELALIIGHEMAHMTEEHAKKQVGVNIAKNPIIKRFASFIAQKKNKSMKTEEISDKEILDRELFQLIFGLGGKLALLKYNRLQEEKADEIGAIYADSVGYDTRKGYDFWKRIASISNDSKWTAFLSTHPYSEQRAKVFLNREVKKIE